MAVQVSVYAHGVLGEASQLRKRRGWPAPAPSSGRGPWVPTGSGPVSAILPGFLPRRGFFADTSESEEDDEEAEGDEEADLATATG